MKIIIPDMGHGNSVGIFKENVTPLLIDCGTRNIDKKINFANLIETTLRKAPTRDLAVTHYHFDHYSLINTFPFGFFNKIYVPALPQRSSTAYAMCRFLSLTSVLTFRDYYLTPVIATRGKTIHPLVKGNSFNALGRNWNVLWPDYVTIDRRNKRRVQRLIGEIDRIAERLTPQKREEFESTYDALSRAFAQYEGGNEGKEHLLNQERFDVGPLVIDPEIETALKSIERLFKDLANGASLVLRDEHYDFLFTGDVDNTILDNQLDFEQNYFFIEAPHHGGYYGQAFDNTQTHILLISRAINYKPRCEYYREICWDTLLDTARKGNCTLIFSAEDVKPKRIGILAYGSIIKNPEIEIEQATISIIRNVDTPFKVEFARKSKTRNGAPTLVPVEHGGAKVKAQIFVMKEGISEKKATDILWRREIHQPESGKEYKRPNLPESNKVFVEKLEHFHDVDIVLYTYLGSNIDPLTPTHLANLAINSVKGALGARKEDGISYLLDVKKQGIKTPLLDEYEKEILRITSTATLKDAWQKERDSPNSLK